MTEKGFITANSGDTDVAGTLSIAAPRALYAVASGHKPKKIPEELLPASPADRGSGIRLIKSEDRKKDDIINRPGRSTYPREKSVLTSGATPVDARLPAVDLPEIILEIAARTGFAAAFTHISERASRASDLELSLCAVLLAEACNTGLEPLTRNDVPALRRERLSWVNQNFVRDDTLRAANALLVGAQNSIPLAQAWGGGEVASADGI